MRFGTRAHLPPTRSRPATYGRAAAPPIAHRSIMDRVEGERPKMRGTDTAHCFARRLELWLEKFI